MAVIACPAGKGRMRHILEEHGVLGCMGIVAAHAIHGRCAYAEMGLDERWLGGIMTLNAQRLDGFGQQVPLHGEMRLVARFAVFLRW